MIENSELIKQVLSTLISISGRKTNTSHAIYMMDKTIDQLKDQYTFLDDIELTDLTYSEEGEMITIMKDVNSISSVEFGSALKDIINTLRNNLGNDAGHFFLKEVSQKIGDDSMSQMKLIGVDLHLMQLEQNISKMESILYNK